MDPTPTSPSDPDVPMRDDNAPDPSAGSGGTPDSDLVKRAIAGARARRSDSQPIPLAIAPDTFPGYTIVREITRGGQGVVYQAVHKSTKRRVAVKVLRSGPFASARDRARFEQEIEILAQLDHPAIVRVHDSGQAHGLHYFVMDYISGNDLDDYIRDSARSVQQIVILFAEICEAVNAAHRRGVVHRDLKPSNIRVDGEGKPHILDFGLAKTALTDSGDGMMSMTGQFIGSTAYASPEQAEGIPAKIDVRSDVYSLGVILYQMLTDHFPYEVIGAFRDVLDAIMKAPPKRPSTISRRIDDEVETIVLKCLAKERDRRYQTAGELARDLRRYLDGEPIEAKRDRGLYVLRKTLQRHRAPALGIAAVLGAIVVGGAVSFVAWRHAVGARREAQAAQAAAESDRAVTQATLDTMLRLFGAINPNVARGSDTRLLRWVLEPAEGGFEALEQQDGRAASSLRSVLGIVWNSVGDIDRAERLLRNALSWREANLGPDHPETAEARINLAMLISGQSQKQAADEAVALATAAVASLDRGRGEVNELARALDAQGYAFKRAKNREDSRRAYERSIALRTQSNTHPRELSLTLQSLAELLYEMNEADAGVPLLERALAIMESDPSTPPMDLCGMQQSLASFLDMTPTRRDPARSRALFDAAMLTLRDRLRLTPEHPYVAATTNKLGIFLSRHASSPQEHDEAIALLTGNLEARRHALPPGHEFIAISRVNLSLALRRVGKLAEARALLAEARAELEAGNAYRAVIDVKDAEVVCERIRLEMERAESENVVRLLGEALALIEEALMVPEHEARHVLAAANVLGAIAAECCTYLEGAAPEASRHAATCAARAYEIAGKAEIAAQWRAKADSAPGRQPK